MVSTRVQELAEQVRRRIPVSLLPALVRARVALEWSRSSSREDARTQMDFVTGASGVEVDLDTIARSYLESQAWRGELRWHPHLVDHQRLVGLEHLQSASALGRGVVITFTHHGQYDGLAPTVEKNGIHCSEMSYPYILTDAAPRWLKQHLAVGISAGSGVVSTDIGIKGIIELLRQGEALLIAVDVPGSTPVRFAGRDLKGSSGSAYAATANNTPVVPLTAEVDSRGPFLRAHPPLLPADHSDTRALFRAVLAVHEPVVLRWPARYDLPLARWGGTGATKPPAGG